MTLYLSKRCRSFNLESSYSMPTAILEVFMRIINHKRVPAAAMIKMTSLGAHVCDKIAIIQRPVPHINDANDLIKRIYPNRLLGIFLNRLQLHGRMNGQRYLNSAHASYHEHRLANGPKSFRIGAGKRHLGGGFIKSS